MLLIKIVRFLRGYVVFRACGGFHERFVNLCAVKQLGLWDVRADRDGVHACIAAADYRRLIPIARTSGARLHVCEKHGLIFFARRYSSRIGILIGAFIFFAFLGLMSSMVWSIEVVGCERLWEETVKETFEQLGLKPGRFASGIDTNAIEDEALVLLEDDIYWASLNIEGSSARIEIAERPKTEMIREFGKPCNYVADFDGVVVSMNVKSGAPAAMVGSGVSAGDLLISGAVENRDTTTSLYEAFGEVVARRTRTLSVSVGKSVTACRLSGAKRLYKICFFGLTVPFERLPAGSYESFERTVSLKAGDIVLPLSLTYTTTVNSSQTEVALTQAQTELLAVSEYNSLYRKEFAATAVLSQTVAVGFDSECCKISSKCDCLDFIGIQKEIVTEPDIV